MDPAVVVQIVRAARRRRVSVVQMLHEVLVAWADADRAKHPDETTE